MSYVDMKVIEVQECRTVQKLVPDDSVITEGNLTEADFQALKEGTFLDVYYHDRGGLPDGWVAPGIVLPPPGTEVPMPPVSDVPLPAAGLMFAAAVALILLGFWLQSRSKREKVEYL